MRLVPVWGSSHPTFLLQPLEYKVSGQPPSVIRPHCSVEVQATPSRYSIDEVWGSGYPDSHHSTTKVCSRFIAILANCVVYSVVCVVQCVVIKHVGIHVLDRCMSIFIV